MTVAGTKERFVRRYQRPKNTSAVSRSTPLKIPMLAYQVGLGVIILALWEFASGRLVRELFVSSPLSVGERLIELLSTAEGWLHIQTTLVEFGVGYVLGSAAGLVVGVLLGRMQFLASLLEPYMLGFYSIPKIALAPLFIVWLGIGLSPKIAIAAFSAFFLVFVNSFSGIRNLNEEFLNLARLMGSSRAFIVRRVMLPCAAPHILLGLRTAVPYAMVGAVVGEFIASNRGLGHLVLRSAQLFDPATLFAGIILIVAIVMGVTKSLILLERRIVRWRQVSETRVQV